VRYFSSGPDIYAAKRDENGDFGPGAAVTELNSAAADIQPNVREDGREVVFASNRDATAGQDIWASTRDTAHDPWSAPVNLGARRQQPGERDTSIAVVGRGNALLRPYARR
jgi:hypothetical protein